ncbi:hypothetical protein [Aureimonas populi]|uniref:Uncharacterized protein n=1 Tax=Aureimonas populi TaxID=1701758 RepID=A0ABW5CNI4_9HYPH|nr:hypothetical protein [Aureimonas populi]
MSERPNDDTKPEDERPDKTPPAGPHAKPDLTDNEKTPGAGSLPDPADDDQDAVSG